MPTIRSYAGVNGTDPGAVAESTQLLQSDKGWHGERAAHDEDLDSIDSLSTLPLRESTVGFRLLRHRRFLSLSVHVSAAYSIVLLALAFSMLWGVFGLDALARNPLTHTWSATLLVWLLVLQVCIVCAPSIQVFLEERRIGSGSASGGPNSVPFKVFELSLPPLALLVLLCSSATTCVWGRPGRNVAGAACLCDRVLASSTLSYGSKVPSDLTVAFVGDNSIADGDEVLELLKGEGTSAVVFNGDAAYLHYSDTWVRRFEEKLGRIPFYVAGGFSDADAEAKGTLLNHWSSREAECRGEVGVSNMCMHRGVGLLLSDSSLGGCEAVSGALTKERFFEHALGQFTAGDVKWPVCVFAFHSNDEGDTDAWDNYNLCLKRGALIVTSHRKRFTRTPEVDRLTSEDPHLHVSKHVGAHQGPSQAAELSSGHSLVIFMGRGGPQLGGNFSLDALMNPAEEVRRPSMLSTAATSIAKHAQVEQLPDDTKAHEPSRPPMTADDIAQDPTTIENGAFFCTFHVHGDPSLAHCYFKDTRGQVQDDFFLHRPDVLSPTGTKTATSYV